MKELLYTIVKPLVTQPERIEITEILKDNMVLFELKVADEDMGRVIGRQGRIAKAIRTIMKAAAIKNNTRAVVEIMS